MKPIGDRIRWPYLFGRLLDPRVAVRLHLAASLLLAACAFVASAPAQADCADPRTCLCAPAGATDGIYWGEVEGGNQVRITEIVVGSADGVDPTVYVVPGVNESVGTQVLVSSNGHLVASTDGRSVSCPSGIYGSTLSVSRSDATRLASSASCFSELDRVTINGEFPSCDDTGGGSDFACAAGGSGGGALGLLVLGALALQRRRTASASIQRA